jgi:hypothetical protein
MEEGILPEAKCFSMPYLTETEYSEEKLMFPTTGFLYSYYTSLNEKPHTCLTLTMTMDAAMILQHHPNPQRTPFYALTNIHKMGS